jgi:hypothetical protein
MALENPGFDPKRKWKCLDVEGEIVGHVTGATAEDAINAYISAASEDPFRREVHTLASGSIRLNVQNLVVPTRRSEI